jgi:hypothetical protein
VLADVIRRQAGACAELGSPMYADLLARVADDLEAGGPAADVLAGHGDDPFGDATALRLMGAVHRLVLLREVPGLAVHYPSVGGTFAGGDQAWEALRRVLAERCDDLRPLLGQPPQTNEVGRSAALVGALLHLVTQHPLPVRLFEIGASAGLNLRADRFRYRSADGRSWGPDGSPVVIDNAWVGTPPPDVPAEQVRVVERAGCDVHPVDPTSTEGRLLLTSYVWADQIPRLERLRGAFRVAADVPAVVTRAGAAQLLAGIELRAGTVTVVWHSIMWQYVGAAERAEAEGRMAALGASASVEAPFARLTLEPRRQPGEPDEVVAVTLQAWPGGAERVLGTAPAHGPPVTWRSG